jgi:hypothetical protein
MVWLSSWPGWSAQSSPAARSWTSFLDGGWIVDALNAGATGYLLKDSEPGDLIRGVQAAARGESPLDPRAARAMLSAQLHAQPAQRAHRSRTIGVDDRTQAALWAGRHRLRATECSSARQTCDSTRDLAVAHYTPRARYSCPSELGTPLGPFRLAPVRVSHVGLGSSSWRRSSQRPSWLIDLSAASRVVGLRRSIVPQVIHRQSRFGGEPETVCTMTARHVRQGVR